MGHFVGIIDLARAPGDNPRAWTLEQPITYYTDGGDAITVWPGATTDGASVPRLFWRIAPPFAGEHLAAALIHDQLYATHGAMDRFTRSQCDAIFREAMIAAGVSRFKAWLLWSAVRIGGGGPFERNLPGEAKAQMEFLEVRRA